jgi:uncharacterized membrane protein
MTVDRRVVTGVIMATAMALARPLLALADAVPPPGTPPATDPIDVSAIAPYVGLAILILIAILAVRSPGSRRPIAAVIVVIGTTFAVLFASLFPGLSCFDCADKPDQTPWTILAIVIAIVGVVLMILIIRGGQASRPASEALSSQND